MELNLCDLLKGREGETLYSLIDGNVVFERIERVDDADMIRTSERLFNADGTASVNADAFCCLWPSQYYFESYKCPRAAWIEWAEFQKLPYWRAMRGDRYWYVDTDCTPSTNWDTSGKADDRYECGNYFRTQEEAIAACEAVRECLQEFHRKRKQK